MRGWGTYSMTPRETSVRPLSAILAPLTTTQCDSSSGLHRCGLGCSPVWTEGNSRVQWWRRMYHTASQRPTSLSRRLAGLGSTRPGAELMRTASQGLRRPTELGCTPSTKTCSGLQITRSTAALPAPRSRSVHVTSYKHSCSPLTDSTTPPQRMCRTRCFWCGGSKRTRNIRT